MLRFRPNQLRRTVAMKPGKARLILSKMLLSKGNMLVEVFLQRTMLPLELKAPIDLLDFLDNCIFYHIFNIAAILY